MNNMNVKNEPQALQTSQIGDFHIKRLIKSGGFGSVYECEHNFSKRSLALKIVSRRHPDRLANQIRIKQ